MLTNYGFLNLTGQPYQLGLNFVALGLEGIFDPPQIETTPERTIAENN